MFIEVNEATSGGLIHALRIDAIDEITDHDLLESRDGRFKEPYDGHEGSDWKLFTGSEITMRNGSTLVVTQTKDEVIAKCRQRAITVGS